MKSNALVVHKPLALAPRFDLPVPVGNLDAYISAINRVPMLTAEEEVQLAREFRDSGNLEAASRLVMSHLRLVVSISRQYLGYGLAHADLIQEGNIGLMKAVKRFDPERGVRLVSFAMHWVKAEIHEYIVRNWRLVKIATTKAQRKLFFNLRSMKTGSGSLTPDQVDHMAHELAVRPEDVIEMETRLSGGDVALEGKADDSDDDFAPIAWLASQGVEPTEVLAARSRDRLAGDGLTLALAALDDRSRDIVQSRWLAEPGEELTLHQLAAQYKVSAERIRQIEVAALKKMKAAFGEFKPGMAA
jgi:RNA polymerase sigma-32 factor